MITSINYCVIILTTAGVQAATIGVDEEDNDEFGYNADTFDDNEFEYFYNMELLEKLELLRNNETEVDETKLLQLAEDDLEYADTTELDIILDKLLEEGNLIEEVLDEIEDEISRTPLLKDDSFMETLNQILFYGFLVAFVFMFTMSSFFTGIHFYKKSKSKADHESDENQKEVEFVFLSGNEKHTRKSQKGVSVGIV